VSSERGHADVSTFLGQIDQDRLAKLNAIRAEAEQEIARILSGAHAESRRFHRENADTVRRTQILERDRSLSRARAELRRQRWRLLQETQARAMARVKELVLEQWSNAERQREWCEYWLQRALKRSGEEDLTLTLGQGGLDATREHLRRMAADLGRRVEVRVDPQRPPGMIAEWDHVVLDGGLYVQCAGVEDMIFSELTNWLHAGEAAGGAGDEQG
jgi:vacuolar-type H+-ATPase subunit E/Vma4